MTKQNTTGFTILEMLVSMSAVMVMLTVISWVFFDTTRSISEGVAMSEALSSSRTISEQLERDAKFMVGPGPSGGFLVIVNRRYTGVRFRSRENPAATQTRNVRSDQLVFFRDTSPESAARLEPLCPGNTNSFSNTTSARHARVWYGHGLRTLPDGSDPADTDGSGTIDLKDERNDIATNWVLCRQALMLANSPSSIHVNGARFDATTDGYGAFNPLLYMGYSDVSDATLEDLTGPVGDLTDLQDAVDSAEGLVPPDPDRDYKGQAYRYAFLNDQRLRVNPTPDDETFTSQQIAQMHPLLAENVSDFIVEFATDIDNDGEVDVNPQGEIAWWGLDAPSGVPSTPNWKAAYLDVPYDHDGDSSTPGFSKATNQPTHQVSPQEYRFVFHHDFPDNWPYLIRVRYRVHDPSGKFEENGESGKWFEQILRVNRP